MRLDDLRGTSNIDDRRGRGGGLVMGGGLALVVFVVAMFLGVDPNQLIGIIQQVAPPGQQQQQQTGPRPDDAAFEFSRKVVGSTEDVWTKIFSARGKQYQPAILTPYDEATPTGCGMGVSAMGPFYCPEDRRVYIDFAFFNEMKSRFGAPGDFAQAYVLAHEVGHNVQAQLGTLDSVHRQMANLSERGANRLSVKLELQADCYAGVWANRANKDFKILEQGDVEEGLAAASAVGDDTLQQQTQGRTMPDSFTHGTSAQRVQWFRRGLDSGDMDACETF